MRLRGADRVKRKLEKMAAGAHKIAAEGTNDVLTIINRQARLNTTGGNPLHVNTGRLRASITQVMFDKEKKIVGTVGTNVFYGKIHETGQPAFIFPKKGKYLKFQTGRRGKGPWVSVKKVKVVKRPWLSKAVTDKAESIKKRLARIPRDIVEVKVDK